MVAVLGWAAGAVDAVAFQVLGRIYVSNMTGNAGGVAISVARGRFWEVLQRGVVFAAFFGGVMLGVVIAAHGRETRRDRRAVLLGIELALTTAMALAILAFAPTGGVLRAENWRFYVLALVTATAMGVQNISLVATSPNGLYTTHLTGAVTELARGVAQRMLGHREVVLRLRAALLVGFLVGAIAAMLVFAWSAFAASMIPVVTIALVLLHRLRQLATSPRRA